MDGINSFLFTNDIKNEYRKNISNLIFYGYQKLIESGKKYSTDSIKSEMEKLSKKTKKIWLEDYFTFDFVKSYLTPNRSKFGLEYISITSQVAEVSSNIEVGKIDIKFSELSDKTYVIIECKRLENTSSKIDKYISEGIKRFTSKKYYPEINQQYAGMIGFLENLTSSITTISHNLNENLKGRSDVKTIQYLDLDSQSPDYKFSSTHSVKSTYEITIDHFWLDYSVLVVQ